MDSAAIPAKLQRAGNELGAKTTYQLFLEREGVPAAGQLNAGASCAPKVGWRQSRC